MNKVTAEYISSRIANVNYHVIDGTTVTICYIKMVNGFLVTGESACADPSIFDKVRGEEYAYEKAFNKLWELEGYLLKERMMENRNG
jgi:hypothetical protein